MKNLERKFKLLFLIVRHKKGNEHADWFKLSFDMFDGQDGPKRESRTRTL